MEGNRQGETTPFPVEPDIEHVHSVLHQLGIETRKPPTTTTGLYEVDVWGRESDLIELGGGLESAGLLPYRPHRRAGHRFFLGFGLQGWLKVDVKLREDDPWRLVGDLAWLLRRRRGMVVALLGADGAGKSTASECIERSMPIDVMSRYLGDAGRSSTDRRPRRVRVSRVRRMAGLAKWIATTLTKLWSIEVAARRGTVVVCDRHPIEAGRIGGESRFVRTIKRGVIRTLAPRPDLIVLLDAPGEILFARKGEHSPEHLDRMSEVWRRVSERNRGIVIGVDRPADQVCHDIQEQIWVRLAKRRAS
jgi:thymidylate kinase